MTAEESKNFAKCIIKDIEENDVFYVCDRANKMCSIGNVSKVIIEYDATGGVISILGIRDKKFHRMFFYSPLKEEVIKIEKLCTEKGINENPGILKKPRTR